jgi:hypothetical protein
VRARDYDGLEAGLRSLARLGSWRGRGARATTFGDLTRDEVLARRDQAKSSLDAFVAASGADLAPLLHEALKAPIATWAAASGPQDSPQSQVRSRLPAGGKRIRTAGPTCDRDADRIGKRDY